MLINTPLIKRYVNEYDITFLSGQTMLLTLDLAAGDTFENDGVKLIVNFVTKPSPTNPEVLLPAEDTVIYLNHVVAIQHRVRELTELTPDQQEEWKETIRAAGGGSIN